MKKIASFLSKTLFITVLIGVIWYFVPFGEIYHRVIGVGAGVYDIWKQIGEDNITFDAIKLDKNDDVVEDQGNLGTEIAFNTTTYIYRTFLNTKQQAVYNQIYANTVDLNTTFRLACTLTASELYETFVSVICDHPEIFWLDNKYQYGYQNGDKDQAVQITLNYNDLAGSLGSAKTGFDSAVQSIYLGAKDLKTQYDKEKYVFDTLADLITYKTGAQYNQTAYSALVLNNTVCAGYARSFQLIMNKLGIPCYYVFGTAKNEYHAWNVIQLDGEWYAVDLTWCDESSGVAYTYFNITDSTLSKNHTRSEMSSKLPVATGTKNAYNAKEEANKKDKDKNNSDNGSSTNNSEENIIYSMNDYNNACYNILVANGTGSYSFTLTLCDTDLYNEICESAKRGDYEAGYLDRVMGELGIKACDFTYSISGNSDDNTGIVTMVQKVSFKEKRV